MKVTTVKEAWNMASRLFPVDYALDSQRSERAGYKIYMSTCPDVYAWICDLGDRLELNYANGSSENIWIEEKEAPRPMTFQQFLAKMEGDSQITVKIRVYGMTFTTKHSAEYFRECDEDETDERGRLLAKSIKDMALVNGQLIVNLE